MTVLLRTFIFCLIYVLSLGCLTGEVFSKELVGVLPFSNQRENQDNDWFGFYLQLRLQSFLAGGCDCEFNSQHTLSLWKSKASPNIPITSKNTVLIEGSFQEVIQYGYIEINLIRYVNPIKKESFQFSYKGNELDSQLEKYFALVGKWITPNFSTGKRDAFTGLDEFATKDFFRFRMTLFDPDRPVEIQQVLRLHEFLLPTSNPDFIADYAEGALILSKDLSKIERSKLFDETEALLRKTAMTAVNHSRIHALLAETFYLNNKYTSWVQVTAGQAVTHDSQNDLALLLLTLTSDSSGDSVERRIKDLITVNPWIWPENDDRAKFQKGLFDIELQDLHDLSQVK